MFFRYLQLPVSIFPRKANNLFEKNVAPILHLAGIEITIVKVGIASYPQLESSSAIGVSSSVTTWLNILLQTDYEGQAKKLMELMEQTDMLIVAGGGGTLQEVITGLLRRPDQVGVIRQWFVDAVTVKTRYQLDVYISFDDNRTKSVTYQSDSFRWAHTIPSVQVFTSSVTTRSSECLIHVNTPKDPDSLIAQSCENVCNRCAQNFSTSCIFQRHHISNTVNSEGRNCTSGCATNQSEKLLLFTLLTY